MTKSTMLLPILKKTYYYIFAILFFFIFVVIFIPLGLSLKYIFRVDLLNRVNKDDKTFKNYKK